ncbi:transmembrane emp24 domain-containing protein p24delta3-like [Dioscorea cayenensis subsp. rotundata]|uniref:Transmembrane emp24 domain-containing protein p24delta3-like n=1 Tax=Dioscorea cayennensis subsp. rotundata TaxID=55577 RepID=A0AB40BKD8_DIOCR|nr:transmembrane emp24 domain-containing protein p24delta3-like [Dioscorea cayenensis subsp. rotundata]
MFLGTEAVWLNVPAGETKCISEEIQADNIVLGEYSVVVVHDNGQLHHGLPIISAKVTTPYGTIIHQKSNATEGEFAFTTSDSGNYQACFSVDPSKDGSSANINLNWKIGIAARDWASVARKEKIEGVELELRKLEMVVKAMHEKLLLLKDKEANMRDMSEKTNSRVVWFSMMSLGVCILASAVQLSHLKGLL